ncbi:M23 family metallopeptidase [Rhizomonospora bruguierae]|uniref:M23 family metallopeptidase n=1 Tax=Rhizomonospora bruguierae TaxID=1581705 RepID=UPI001BCDF162|nr:M23 family metallopeptidase [Micromonospora sp. NBRC 107566]
MGRIVGWVASGVAVLLLLIIAATAGIVSSVFGGGGGGGSCVGAVTVPGATPARLTAEQARNAGKFYEALLRVPGWERLPLTEAAQKVQRSAYPDAYAKHETWATEIVAAYTDGTLPVCDGAPISAAGWTRPVVGTAGSGFRTGERSGHDGVDIMAGKGTVIRAASGGVVVRVRCNVGGDSWEPTGGPMPCDRDGYPGLGGCGWYAEIRHAGDIVSRYCHMVRQPIVRVGQTVIVGQSIGNVGSSGNSSGPHLHYEIHEGYPATENNAVDPFPFMLRVGVTL